MNAQAQLAPPAIGQIWPGQGGIYQGIRHYPEGPCYLIAAAKDLPGRFAFGDRGELTEATSRTDGRANTEILLAREGKHPAAIAAAAYTADGHTDFSLPSIGELNHAWQFAPDSYATDDWYVSSSQRSADNAFDMDFEGGDQDFSGKHVELRVRPVRRLPIQ